VRRVHGLSRLARRVPGRTKDPADRMLVASSRRGTPRVHRGPRSAAILPTAELTIQTLPLAVRCRVRGTGVVARAPLAYEGSGERLPTTPQTAANYTGLHSHHEPEADLLGLRLRLRRRLLLSWGRGAKIDLGVLGVTARACTRFWSGRAGGEALGLPGRVCLLVLRCCVCKQSERSEKPVPGQMVTACHDEMV